MLLQMPKTRVCSVLREEVVMAAALHDFSVSQDQYLVRVMYRPQFLGNRDDRPI